MKVRPLIIIPAYNEEKSIGKVIDSLRAEGYDNLFVVDDACTDRTENVLMKKKTNFVCHPLNRGLGGALSTGFEYARRNHETIAVTFDADGQHDAKEIANLIRPIVKGQADVVIGSRMKKTKGMPFIRVVGNFGLNVVTFVLFGIWTTDSQSGFRAFSNHALNKIRIKTNRMEVSSEFFNEIKRNKLKFKEIPIKPIYSDYSKEKGQSSLNAINIVVKLIIKKLMR